MNKSDIFLGQIQLNNEDHKVEGNFVAIDNERYYKISNVNKMDDFFMTIVSDSDHWMYISSNGSLTAGRKNRNSSLFPYYTVDKIHDYCGVTGSKTIFIVQKEDKKYLWEPFSKNLANVYRIERNLYKNEFGNKLIFEEINFDLNIKFQYAYNNSDKFGLVRRSKIENLGDVELNLSFIDGMQNILPQGVEYEFQNEFSNLLDGYKKNELLEKSRLGLFMLSSIPVDRAEPSESLNATTVWSRGLSSYKILLSNNQIDNFSKGLPVENEIDIRARRGSFYVNADLCIKAKEKQEWMMVAEVNQNTTDVANLNQYLLSETKILKTVNADVEKGTQNLVRIVASSDGMQVSKEELNSVRHFSNTMFNVMRGGVFLNNYTVESLDFKAFVLQTNKKIAAEFDSFLNDLPQSLSKQSLVGLVEETNNTDFLRICNEYLPLTFSRRHGDPSRPWNQFSIDNKNEDGTLKSDFQGNWRDIFQNWEALCLSYPGFTEDIIAKFLNASTPDGYNPYRITRSGIDWECPDPEDPWAYIGYWGDHQIIYLQKLLELSKAYHPGKLDDLLSTEKYAYANVPYRIKPYTEIVKDPKDTIEFDFELNKSVQHLAKELGSDGKLLQGKNRKVYHVNLTEKILVTMLAKLSNFIPEAGIWLNTQRPEWNDANNALVGNGVSMVTLYYLRRFLQFWKDSFSSSTVENIAISSEVKQLFDAIFQVFTSHSPLISKGFSDEQRKQVTDELGNAGTTYRKNIYSVSFTEEKSDINVKELTDFLSLALDYCDQSIRVNKREDGLFHAYNLISFKENKLSIRYLYEMLEGQVAVLSSGYLNGEECLNVLDSLKSSKLFRADQYSYILYPDRQLPRFEDKNNIPVKSVNSSELLKALVNQNDKTIIDVDNTGQCHFKGTFRNASNLKDALAKLDSSFYGELVANETALILDIYEEMFDHQSFTGRSGTFFAFEGLGSIYWHMVSKLLLATQESFFKAVNDNNAPEIIGRIKDHYFEIKAGIGLNKSPELYGAFPTDAYSHTPGNGGAKQPGMTGQVKEDIISRMGELGVRIQQGEIKFVTQLINEEEFLKKQKEFKYINLNNKLQTLTLNDKQLAFTICQVPIVYTLADRNEIIVAFTSGQQEKIMGNSLNAKTCASIFNREGNIERIELSLKQN